MCIVLSLVLICCNCVVCVFRLICVCLMVCWCCFCLFCVLCLCSSYSRCCFFLLLVCSVWKCCVILVWFLSFLRLVLSLCRMFFICVRFLCVLERWFLVLWWCFLYFDIFVVFFRKMCMLLGLVLMMWEIIFCLMMV